MLARTMVERARRQTEARKRGIRIKVQENPAGIWEMYNSKVNAKRVTNSRGIKRISSLSKAGSGHLVNHRDPHSNRAPKTTGVPRMLVGLDREVVGGPTRNDPGWLSWPLWRN